MVIMDADGKIVLVNTQTERLFGYRREELLGQPVEVLVPEPMRAKHVQQRNGYLANPVVRPMGSGLDLYGIRKDGSQFPVEISLGPLDAEEGLLVSAAVRDISEHASGTREAGSLCQATAAEQPGVRTVCVRGSPRLARTAPQNSGVRGSPQMRAASGDQGREYLERMQGAAARMQNLINDLLTFSRVTSKPRPFQPVDLTQVTQEVVSDLESRIQQTGGQVEMADLPTVDADLLQMRPVVPEPHRQCVEVPPCGRAACRDS